MVNQYQISICMMIKNEEKNLKRCLDSIKPLIQSDMAELIIVDTGSTDQSMEIAHHYTQKLYEHPWTGNFSEMRNVSISYASGEWIFILDADEEVQNIQRLIEIFKGDLSKYNTLNAQIKNYYDFLKDGQESDYTVINQQRFFRRTKEFGYHGVVHNQPKYELPILNTDIFLGHYGYIWKDEELKIKKYERTANLLKNEIQKKPEDIYYRYQLSVSESIMDHQEALTQIRIAYDLSKKIPKKDRYAYIYIYSMHTKIATQYGYHQEVIEVGKKGIELEKNLIDVWFYLTNSYHVIKDYKRAIDCAIAYLKCYDIFDKTAVYKNPACVFYRNTEDSQDKVKQILTNSYLETGSYDQAEDTLYQLKKVEDQVKFFFKMVKDTEKYDKIDSFFDIIEFEKDRSTIYDMIEVIGFDAEGEKAVAQEILKIYEKFDWDKDDYYLLMCYRSNKEKYSYDKAFIKEVMSINFSSLSVYYGDLLELIFDNNLPIEQLEKWPKTDVLTKMLQRIQRNKSDNLLKQIYDYLTASSLDTLEKQRVIMVFQKYLLATMDKDYINYKLLTEKYIENGTAYLSKIYSSHILSEEFTGHFLSDEHLFFLYMYLAEKVNNQSKKEYIRYLKEAIKIYPLANGVDYIKEQMEKMLNAESEVKSEMETLKSKLKDNIQILIQAQKFDEAQKLVDQYLSFMPMDEEILYYKSEILLNS